MGKKEAEILRKIKELGKPARVVEIGSVVKVDEENMTAVVAIDGLAFTCALNGFTKAFKGFVGIPTIGSDVLLLRLDDDGNRYTIIATTELEKLYIKGGKSGEGLINIEELISQLGKLSARVDGIIGAINSSTVIATPQDGGTALLGLLRTQIAKIQESEDFSKIEDETILKKY